MKEKTIERIQIGIAVLGILCYPMLIFTKRYLEFAVIMTALAGTLIYLEEIKWRNSKYREVGH